MNTTTTPATATPAKLRDGTWGARCPAGVAVGDTVTITTRAGKSWQARVTRVVWTGEGVAICATQSLDRPASPAPAPARYGSRREGGCHTGGDCSSLCSPTGGGCPCADGSWFRCC